MSTIIEQSNDELTIYPWHLSFTRTRIKVIVCDNEEEYKVQLLDVDKVVTLCPLCHDEAVWLYFAEDGRVFNCEKVEIIPEILTVCENCTNVLNGCLDYNIHVHARLPARFRSVEDMKEKWMALLGLKDMPTFPIVE